MKRMQLVLAIAITTACSAPVDIQKAVQVDMMTSAWLRAGSSDGRNKIVPAVTVTVKNLSDRVLTAVQVNAVFRLVSTNEELGSEFRSVSGSGGLPPGAQTEKITLKAQRGYTGADPFDALLRHSQFVDAQVEVFVKAGSGQWTRIGEYPIARAFQEAGGYSVSRKAINARRSAAGSCSPNGWPATRGGRAGSNHSSSVFTAAACWSGPRYHTPLSDGTL